MDTAADPLAGGTDCVGGPGPFAGLWVLVGLGDDGAEVSVALAGRTVDPAPQRCARQCGGPALALLAPGGGGRREGAMPRRPARQPSPDRRGLGVAERSRTRWRARPAGTRWEIGFRQARISLARWRREPVPMMTPGATLRAPTARWYRDASRRGDTGARGGPAAAAGPAAGGRAPGSGAAQRPPAHVRGPAAREPDEGADPVPAHRGASARERRRPNADRGRGHAQRRAARLVRPAGSHAPTTNAPPRGRRAGRVRNDRASSSSTTAAPGRSAPRTNDKPSSAQDPRTPIMQSPSVPDD